jgi:dTDP-4-dehydrorhamnose 3,5-epimerase
LNDVVVLRTQRFEDERGYFEETFKSDVFATLGIATRYVQDNHSRSHKGVIRGLHFQHTPAMGKLLRVVRGEIQLVELDVRPDSFTYGQYVEIDVSDTNGRIVWIPPGFANGFCVLSDVADVVYKCTAVYNPAGESSVNPLDPSLAISWKTGNPILSDKDRNAPFLKVQ